MAALDYILAMLALASVGLALMPALIKHCTAEVRRLAELRRVAARRREAEAWPVKAPSAALATLLDRARADVAAITGYPPAKPWPDR